MQTTLSHVVCLGVVTCHREGISCLEVMLHVVLCLLGSRRSGEIHEQNLVRKGLETQRVVVKIQNYKLVPHRRCLYAMKEVSRV